MKSLLVFACMAVCGAAQAEGWLDARQQEFAQWQSTHPDAELRAEKLLVRTTSRFSPGMLGAVAAPAVVHRFIGALGQLWDDPVAPRLTVIPAGEFTMGSPETEPDRQAAEGPQHRVVISHPFAVGTYLVMRDEYAAFVADTKRPDPQGCILTHLHGQNGETKGFNWHNPGFAQGGNEPVVCVSWKDARAYAAWLSGKTGRSYRLLSEAEWEYALRAGSTTSRPWGDAIGYDNANYRAEDGVAKQWQFTSPVGQFPPNAFGLYDVLGNVWQRVDDCWNPDFTGAPTDGSPWIVGDCTLRTGHAGGFDAPAKVMRSSFRGKVAGDAHYSDGGFRIARDL